MKKKIFSLKIGNTRRRVETLCLGNLAIHHGRTDWPQQPPRTDWSITHIPSGLSLCTCRLQRTAKQIVVALQEKIHYVGALADYAVSLEKGCDGARNKLKRLLQDYGADPYGGTNYTD